MNIQSTSQVLTSDKIKSNALESVKNFKTTPKTSGNYTNQKSDPIDFEQLVHRSSIEAKRQRAIKEQTATGKELFEVMEQKKVLNSGKNHKTQLDKDDFMKLFITQLQVQDPTKPIENVELAQQMAQFTSLEQLMELGKGINNLIQSNDKGNFNSLVNFIGKSVETDGGRFQFDGKTKGRGQFEIDRPITRGKVVVRDSHGQKTGELSLEKQKEGLNTFTWDGRKLDGTKASKGVYFYEVEGVDINSRPVPVKIATVNRVTGVRMQGDVPVLITDLGMVDVDAVRAINSTFNKSKENNLE